MSLCRTEVWIIAGCTNFWSRCFVLLQDNRIDRFWYYADSPMITAFSLTLNFIYDTIQTLRTLNPLFIVISQFPAEQNFVRMLLEILFRQENTGGLSYSETSTMITAISFTWSSIHDPMPTPQNIASSFLSDFLFTCWAKFSQNVLWDPLISASCDVVIHQGIYREIELIDTCSMKFPWPSNFPSASCLLTMFCLISCSCKL